MRFLVSLLMILMCSNAFAVSIESDPNISYALRTIKNQYGDKVGLTKKSKALFKFGRNGDLSTAEETVWQVGGFETYPTTNAIDKISSSSGSDTGDVVVEGHTISGSDLTFVVQTITLEGQTEKALTTPLYRVNRLYNGNSTAFVGDIYVYEDDTVTAGVPQTAAKIHLKAPLADNQSLKAATATSSQDYWIVTQVCGSVDRQQTRSVDFKLRVKEPGGVFRTKVPFSVNSYSGTVCLDLKPHLIVPPNSDIKMDAISSSTATEVGAIINGYLAIKDN